MAMNENAVLTAARGYIYTAPVGAPAPTPAEIAAFDPDTFGAQVLSLTPDTDPTGGTYTITYGGETTEAIAYDAPAGTIQEALNALDGVDPGTLIVTGGPLSLEPVLVSLFGEGTLTVSVVDLDDTTMVDVSVETPANGWNNIGHTSRGTLPEFGSDGGDTEVKGSWQNESLREVETDTLVEYVTLTAHQFDEETMTLYYGRNAANEPGVFGVASGSRVPVERAFLVVIVDGEAKIANHAPKVSIRREEALTFATDEFTEIPLRATYLKFGNKRLFDWISEDTGLGA